jgi:type VI secretion system secreted protein VgrG
VRSTHSFVSRDYRTTSEDAPLEDVYSGNYEFLPSDQVFRAPLLTERPVIHGAQTAKVVCKGGEEIDVDKHGRITVQFFWDRNKTTSIRVRVAQVWAGKGWGGMFIPRVDQEVVVIFLEGDPDRPLVVGAVYNGENTVPYELEAMKTWNGIKSDSTKGGGGYNEWVFQDKKGSELVRGHAQRDLQFDVLNNEKWNIGVNSDTEVGDTLTITAGTKIELKVGGNKVVIDGSGVTIKGVAKIDADSPMTTVKGTGTLTLNGGLVKIN